MCRGDDAVVPIDVPMAAAEPEIQPAAAAVEPELVPAPGPMDTAVASPAPAEHYLALLSMEMASKELLLDVMWQEQDEATGQLRRTLEPLSSFLSSPGPVIESQIVRAFMSKRGDRIMKTCPHALVAYMVLKVRCLCVLLNIFLYYLCSAASDTTGPVCRPRM